MAAQDRGPQSTPAAEIVQSIGRLGDLDFPVRMQAARIVRRTDAAVVVPVLLQTAREHADGYVRFRALVLLTGFNDPRIADVMRDAAASPNDRLREVAFGYFEQHPDATLASRWLKALDEETGEFVRPALVRALAAVASTQPEVRAALIRDARRGVDYFRSTVIEALGDYRVGEAVPTLLDIASLDGPLQDDAILALGRIGDRGALRTMVALQRSGPETLQPTLAAAFCLLEQNCERHITYLRDVLGFAEGRAGYQELLRAAASGLGALGAAGRSDALAVLLSAGIPSRQEVLRAPAALALGLVALRNTPLIITALESHPERAEAIRLLAEGFDMLEEDLEEERFYVAVRRTYWSAPEGSTRRAVCDELIRALEF
jgi:HEAT repeat protein